MTTAAPKLKTIELEAEALSLLAQLNSVSASHTVMTVNVIDSEDIQLLRPLQKRLDFLQSLLGCDKCAMCQGDKCPTLRG